MPSAVNTYGKIVVNGNVQGSRLTTSGMVLNLDAGDPKSYPGLPSGNAHTDESLTWYDLSTQGNHYFLLGGPTWQSNPPCFTFDGIDDWGFDITAYDQSVIRSNVKDTYYATSSGPPTYALFTTPSDNRTLELWFRLNNTINQYAGLFAFQLNQSGALMYNGYGENEGKFVWTWDDSLQGGIAATNKTVTVGEWIQLVVILRSGHYFTYYVNGQLDKPEQQTTDTAVPVPVYWFTMASDFRFRYRLACSISIVRVYNRILTAEEILNNYNSNKGRFGLK